MPREQLKVKPGILETVKHRLNDDQIHSEADQYFGLLGKRPPRLLSKERCPVGKTVSATGTDISSDKTLLSSGLARNLDRLRVDLANAPVRMVVFVKTPL